jgi:hypothetical protein
MSSKVLVLARPVGKSNYPSMYLLNRHRFLPIPSRKLFPRKVLAGREYEEYYESLRKDP